MERLFVDIFVVSKFVEKLQILWFGSVQVTYNLYKGHFVFSSARPGPGALGTCEHCETHISCATRAVWDGNICLSATSEIFNCYVHI